MIHVIDEQLRDEARRFRLVFACPECASFDVGDHDGGAETPPNPLDHDGGAETPPNPLDHDGGAETPPNPPARDGGRSRTVGQGGRCSLGFPNEPHREADLEGRDQVVFCKAFEAW